MPVPLKKGDITPDPTHAALFGHLLQERAALLGVAIVLDYPGRPDPRFSDLTNYLLRVLRAPRPASVLPSRS